MTDILLNAKVIWWNSDQICIECPFCERTHKHGFTGNYSNDQTRVSHRHPLPSLSELTCRYNLVFPFDIAQDDPSPQFPTFEIDKKEGRFVTAGYAKDDNDRTKKNVVEPVTALSNAFGGMDIKIRPMSTRLRFKDATETLHTPREREGQDCSFDEQRTITLALADCVSGNVDSVKRYLDTVGERDRIIFLQGVDDSGDTALISAACEDDEGGRYNSAGNGVVALLLSSGSKVDAQNDAGRTALMQAALWGRLHTVLTLLKHGADVSLRDQEGRTAIDLAQISSKNEEERCQRNETLQEVVHHSNNKRRLIIRILQHKQQEKQKEKDERDRKRMGEGLRSYIVLQGFSGQSKSCHFTRDKLSITAWKPTVHYSLSFSYKTVAHLERGGSFPSIAAMSGWSTWTPPLIDGARWTAEVEKIANLVGYRLTEHQHDQEEEGRYLACHAEKQLIAYFISKHVFLSEDVEELSDEDWEEKAAMAYLQDEEAGGARGERSLRRLSEVYPKPLRMLKANIWVGKEDICPDCLEFRDKVNSEFGLDISMSVAQSQ